MELVELTAKEYENIFAQPYHVFNSAAFAELNRAKFEWMYYLAFRDGKFKAGIILGEREQTLYSPPSAPFGGISFLKEDISVETLDNVVESLSQFGKAHRKQIEVTLPPSFYAPDFIAKCINVFSRSAFSPVYTDLNFQMEVCRLGTHYPEAIPYTGKKNLANALKNQLTFRKAIGNEEIGEAYCVIKANRESKGYPLRMTLENVMETIQVIDADFFLLYLVGQPVAAAQVFHVANGIVQVIYWGDVPGYEDLRPMNMLAYELYEYYRKAGIRIIDIGPSTESGIPNYGLCQYKTTIGCSVATKHKYVLKCE